MTNKTAAHRYARALFDVASAEHANLQQIESDLAGFVDLLKREPAFEKILLNPAVPAPRKRAAVDEVSKRAALTPIVARMLGMLAERDRLVIVPDLLASYRERLLDQQHIVRAEVTSAAPITPDRMRDIERSLASATGRTVVLSTHVDPSLIGGLVARVGSTVYDGSLTRQLERMKKRLEDS